MSKKPRFTHVRDNLRGEVSGKRFNAHVVERNVAGNGKRVAAGRRCGACHIPTRHNIDMALRHWGAHGDNFGDQCVPGVRK